MHARRARIPGWEDRFMSGDERRVIPGALPLDRAEKHGAVVQYCSDYCTTALLHHGGEERAAAGLVVFPPLPNSLARVGRFPRRTPTYRRDVFLR